jgi:hypothetical protein
MCPPVQRRPALRGLRTLPVCAALLFGAHTAVHAQHAQHAQHAAPAAAQPPSPVTGPAVTAGTAARPQPSDAHAPVPPLRHVSALPAHTRSAPVPVGDWAALNQQVARIGGWRAYAREAAAATPASAPAPSHGGHR